LVLLTVAYSIVVTAPLFPTWTFWLLIASVIPCAIFARWSVRGVLPDAGNVSKNKLLDVKLLIRRTTSIALVAALVCLCGLSVRGNMLDHFLRWLFTNNKVSIVASGALAAMFAGDLIVAMIVKPYVTGLSKKDPAGEHLSRAGAQIGWIERAVFFAFVAGGQPAAAVLALTAKSVTRLPSLREGQEGFVEYVIIGSMVSIFVALFAAVVTRLAIGLHPIS
jgi:hypothetical protein